MPALVCVVSQRHGADGPGLAVHAGDRRDGRRVRDCRRTVTVYGVTTTVALALSIVSVMVVAAMLL